MRKFKPGYGIARRDGGLLVSPSDGRMFIYTTKEEATIAKNQMSLDHDMYVVLELNFSDIEEVTKC